MFLLKKKKRKRKRKRKRKKLADTTKPVLIFVELHYTYHLLFLLAALPLLPPALAVVRLIVIFLVLRAQIIFVVVDRKYLMRLC